VVIDLIGDLLSPPRCAGCDAAVARRNVFCASCATSVERCDAHVPSDDRDPSPARAARAPVSDAAFGWYGGALAQAIRRLKYEDRPDLARPLGSLLRSACRDAKVRADAVLPVPLHPRRLVERGYNQSALLAAHVAREIGAPLLTSTHGRIVDTTAQVELSGAARAENVAAAFSVSGRAWVEGRTLLLVDDVTTTGATLDAARRPLLAAGARAVLGLALAQTPSSLL
jgi:ComF family protein